MKYINSIVLSCSVLAASVALVAALDAQPQSALVVGAGNDLRCRLEKGLRITKSGEPITAKLVEPVYAGTTIAIPEGSTIKGHVSSISNAPGRAGHILRGDFTPPRTAHVTFDNVILPDGTAVQIHTDATIGVSDVKMAQYLPKSQRPGVRQKMEDVQYDQHQRTTCVRISTIPCARCRAASPTINGRRRSQGRAPASSRYSEIKSPTKHICSTCTVALHLGSRMVSVLG